MAHAGAVGQGLAVRTVRVRNASRRNKLEQGQRALIVFKKKSKVYSTADLFFKSSCRSLKAGLGSGRRGGGLAGG